MKHTSALVSWLFPAALALAAIFFLPAVQDFYDMGKFFFIIALSLATLAGSAWTLAHRHSQVALSLGTTTRSLTLLALAGTASLIMASTNKVEALMHPLGIVLFGSLALVSCVLPMVRDEHTHTRLLWAYFWVTTILSLLAVYQLLGMGRIMFPSVAFLADPLWTPTGSTLATATMLLLSFPLVVGHTIRAVKRNHETHMVLLLIMTIVIAVGIGVTLWELIPRIPATILPFSQGWAITLEILKSPKQALFGVGAENFLAAFSAARPASVNVTPLWSVRFLTNSSVLFHYMTVWGLLGLGALLFTLRTLWRNRPGHTIPGLSWALFLGILAILLSPPSVSVVLTLFVLLLLSETHAPPTIIPAAKLSSGKRIFFLTLIGLFIAGSLYFTGKAYASERLFARSLAAARSNNGTETYTLQTKAIQANPKNSRLRIYFSQTNLALATSLATSLSEQPDASSAAALEDRDLVAQLVSQSIREAKTAVSLNPVNILAWENLARTYEQLIGVAQGADGWAVATLKEAIKRDPVNPVLPLELGGMYVRMKNYTEAITQFERATTLKPDYANAWYNLGNAYKLNGDLERTKEAWAQAQKYVPAGSEDYSLITNELNGLQGPVSPEIPTPQTPTTLSTPAPTPIFVPPLEIPNN